MSTAKIVLLSIAGFLALLITIFVLTSADLAFTRFFKPKYQNVERKVFEETKSYVHGKIQQLSKYYREYQSADMAGKETLKKVVQVEFAEFDSNNITEPTLRNFLVTMRGY